MKTEHFDRRRAAGERDRERTDPCHSVHWFVREPASPRADLWNGRANERRGWPIFVFKAIFRHCARLVLMRRQIENIIACVSDKRRTACGRLNRVLLRKASLRQCFALCTALRRLRLVCTLSGRTFVCPRVRRIDVVVCLDKLRWPTASSRVPTARGSRGVCWMSNELNTNCIVSRVGSLPSSRLFA
jgi:hypothetical protein